MLKVVIDTNVFISGLIKNPSCREIINAFKEEKFTLFISVKILDELIGVISRPKFHNIITRKTAEKLIETIKTQAVLIKPLQHLDIIKDDPEDNRFLETAIEAKATHIITNHKHILALKPLYQGIPILTSLEFLKLLSK